jgi:hypothetical protein
MHIDASQAEAFVYNRGYTFRSGGKKYLQVVFNKVEQILQSDVLELMPENKPASKETQKNHDPKFVIQQILEREGRASTEQKEEVRAEIKPVKIQELETQKEVKEVENPDILLTLSEVLKKYPVSRSSFYRLLETQKFQTKTGKIIRGKAPILYSENELTDYFNKSEPEKSWDIMTI